MNGRECGECGGVNGNFFCADMDGSKANRAVDLPPQSIELTWRRLHMVCDSDGVKQIASDIRKLPQPYRMRMFSDKHWQADRMAWAELETAVGEFKQVTDAVARFDNEFLPHKAVLSERMVFLCHGDRVVATATGWDRAILASGAAATGTLHWVAVHPHHQGHGLAKIVAAQAIKQLRNQGWTENIYLSTQTTSARAVKMYLEMGFRPWISEDAISGTPEAAIEGWRLMDEVLKPNQSFCDGFSPKVAQISLLQMDS